jgi:hypothetical protein
VADETESTKLKVKKAEKQDIKSMLELNYKIYPPEWHVTEHYVKKIMSKNPEVYNILTTKDGTKGIVSLFPLNKDIYESILNGKIEEDDLSEYILDYFTPKEVYIYLISLIVDVFDPNRKTYAKNIIQSIPFELKRILAKGIDIKEIGAIAISPEGEKILPKIGFTQNKEVLSIYNQKYPVFRASVNDVISSINIK